MLKAERNFDKIEEYALQGLSIRQIAKKLDMNHCTVYYLPADKFDRLNKIIRERSTRLEKPEIVAKTLELFANQYDTPLNKIAEEVGVDLAHVSLYLTKYFFYKRLSDETEIITLQSKINDRRSS